MKSDKKIITISREFGSGGRLIGKRLAEKLGVPYYDKELLDRIAEESGFSREMMEDAEKTCLFVERMADFFRYNVRKMSEDATLGEEPVRRVCLSMNVFFWRSLILLKKSPAKVPV